MVGWPIDTKGDGSRILSVIDVALIERPGRRGMPLPRVIGVMSLALMAVNFIEHRRALRIRPYRVWSRRRQNSRHPELGRELCGVKRGGDDARMARAHRGIHPRRRIGYGLFALRSPRALSVDRLLIGNLRGICDDHASPRTVSLRCRA